MIPKNVKIKNNKLPNKPGVYLMKDVVGEILYIGKATSLKHRVESYFTRPRDPSTSLRAGSRIEKLVSEIVTIDYIEQPTAIEALFLEASLIKRYQPFYNILEKDDKSFSYLVITNEDFPRPFILRATDFDDRASKKYKAVYGPFTSARAVRAALDVIRKAIPWTTCIPPTSLKLRGTGGQKRACFYVHLKQCPGVCVNSITKREYAKVIRDMIAFFEGKRFELIKKYSREMKAASKAHEYEKAGEIRNRLFALEHIRDISVIAKDDPPDIPINLSAGASAKEDKGDIRRLAPNWGIFGRVEGYDISNISGTSATGSMVVFRHGGPEKSLYRKFKIRTVFGPDDYASLREVLRRRFTHSEHGWEWPDLILIDGGAGQVNVALQVLAELPAARIVPVVGMAKGPDRDKDELVIPPAFEAMRRMLEEHRSLLVHVRDESHRFAIAYHRKLRGKIK